MSPISEVLAHMRYFADNAFTESGRVSFEAHCRKIASGIIASATDSAVHVSELEANDCPPVESKRVAPSSATPSDPGPLVGILKNPDRFDLNGASLAVTVPALPDQSAGFPLIDRPFYPLPLPYSVFRSEYFDAADYCLDATGWIPTGGFSVLSSSRFSTRYVLAETSR